MYLIIIKEKKLHSSMKGNRDTKSMNHLMDHHFPISYSVVLRIIRIKQNNFFDILSDGFFCSTELITKLMMNLVFQGFIFFFFVNFLRSCYAFFILSSISFFESILYISKKRYRRKLLLHLLMHLYHFN
jgi:hypothetical protein